MFFFFFNSWGANHCAKNWGCIRGSGGSLPCNVHQVPPVPFWQVQDPLWSEREWHPAHPLGRWRVAANGPNCASPNPSPRLRFVTFVIAPGCLDYLWTADDTFCMFTEETFAHLRHLTHTHSAFSGNGRFNEWWPFPAALVWLPTVPHQCLFFPLPVFF